MVIHDSLFTVKTVCVASAIVAHAIVVASGAHSKTFARLTARKSVETGQTLLTLLAGLIAMTVTIARL